MVNNNNKEKLFIEKKDNKNVKNPNFYVFQLLRKTLKLNLKLNQIDYQNFIYKNIIMN